MAGITGGMPEGGLQLIAFTTAVELSLLFARLPGVLASWLCSRFYWVSSDSPRVGSSKATLAFAFHPRPRNPFIRGVNALGWLGSVEDDLASFNARRKN
jgi:hypothetical protein